MITFTLTQDLTTGESISFVDTSVITYANIKKTRFVIGNYLAFNNPTLLTVNGVMDQYREYKSLTLTGYTYDSKIIPVNGLLVPQITGITVQSGSQMQTTGNYVYPTTFLPTANYTPRILTVVDIGIDAESNGSIPDMVYALTYEHYIDTSPTTPTNVVEGKQYIVYGTGATATYAGSTYRENEIFIAADSGAISFTGGGTVKVLSDIKFSYFALTYNIQSQLKELQLWMYQNCTDNQDLTYRINVMYAKLNAITFGVIQNYANAGLTQALIDDILNELGNIRNNYEIY